MTILALETSLEIVSCAVWDSERKILRSELKAYAYQTLAQKLPVLVKSTLESAEVTLKEADLIAISLGPGSFTSVRVGLAFAKGLAMALDKPIIGVSALEALALMANADEKSLIVALYPSRPSRPTEVYAAFFKVCNNSLVQEGSQFACDFSLLLIQLCERNEERIVLVGTLPHGAKNVLAGWSDKEKLLLPLTPQLPSASALAQRAWQIWLERQKSDDPVILSPVYVLPSSAENRFGITVSVRQEFDS
ncbi:MAG: tRNA (adenosine(37)-N6)-threonylcarbamoyltransferase complex dimerization subunit type 1 TsaB [Armatimonadetes bacterium]|nr:tRNA (adenosine(37)-N6)-threonylcarbamoyltransferase complex dimerization subunit type 1 TsaB [Armatimonadota bacterium]